MRGQTPELALSCPQNRAGLEKRVARARWPRRPRWVAVVSGWAEGMLSTGIDDQFYPLARPPPCADNKGGLSMIYSRSAEYAIRSFVYLARIPDGKFAMARHIAEEEKIPAHFLAKILQELTRKGLLRSNKGPSG